MKWPWSRRDAITELMHAVIGEDEVPILVMLKDEGLKVTATVRYFAPMEAASVAKALYAAADQVAEMAPMPEWMRKH